MFKIILLLCLLTILFIGCTTKPKPVQRMTAEQVLENLRIVFGNPVSYRMLENKVQAIEAEKKINSVTISGD